MEGIQIIRNILPVSQYVHETTEKKYIALHHTAGGSAMSSIEYWKSNSDKVATHFIIDRNGDIYQTMSMLYYGYHLGLKTKEYPNRIALESQAVSIEICSLGYLEKKGNDYISPVTKKKVDAKIVETCEFRGFDFWETYTEKQVESLGQLIDYIGTTMKFKPESGSVDSDWFDFIPSLNKGLLKGRNIYTHTNFRKDKFDCFPCEKLINLLRKY